MIYCKILCTLLFFIFEGKAFFFLIVRNTKSYNYLCCQLEWKVWRYTLYMCEACYIIHKLIFALLLNAVNRKIACEYSNSLADSVRWLISIYCLITLWICRTVHIFQFISYLTHNSTGRKKRSTTIRNVVFYSNPQWMLLVTLVPW